MGYTMLCRHGYQTFGKKKESLAKYHFTHAGFQVLNPTFICDGQGNYLNGISIKAKLKSCPGWAKTPTTEDIHFITDNLMGIDFFIDCGSFIAGIDCTIISNEQNLNKKLFKAKARIDSILHHNLSMKLLNKHTGKWYIKPITKIIVYSFDPNQLDPFNENHMFIMLQHTRKINIFRHQ